LSELQYESTALRRNHRGKDQEITCMPADHFKQAGAGRRQQIEAAQNKGATGFFSPDYQWEEPIYLLDGVKVTKEEFILLSGLEHLMPGVSTVRCSKCERQSSPSHWHETCGMLQPGGAWCDGVFF
jgi:hypothetical protein